LWPEKYPSKLQKICDFGVTKILKKISSDFLEVEVGMLLFILNILKTSIMNYVRFYQRKQADCILL
jgi:hypothetical protein